MAMRRAVRILSFISSFSCLNEYFLPEVSSLGRLTGQTEIIGSTIHVTLVGREVRMSHTFHFGPDFILFWATSENN